MDLTAKYILNYIITTVNFNGRELYPQVIYWELPTNMYHGLNKSRVFIFVVIV